ncbi:hypothetical protein NKI24_19835 [Mesorhizobium sp. M0701]
MSSSFEVNQWSFPVEGGITQLRELADQTVAKSFRDSVYGVCYSEPLPRRSQVSICRIATDGEAISNFVHCEAFGGPAQNVLLPRRQTHGIRVPFSVYKNSCTAESVSRNELKGETVVRVGIQLFAGNGKADRLSFPCREWYCETFAQVELGCLVHDPSADRIHPAQFIYFAPAEGSAATTNKLDGWITIEVAV